jgi:hypothetical protein
MTAYNSSDLYNKQVREEASTAFNTNCIDDETYRKILDAHASKLYSPNFFIRLALGILTVVAILFFLLLLIFFFKVSGSVVFIGLFVFLSLACYAVLELMVKAKNYYNAGVDNMLMCAVPIFIAAASVLEDYSNQNLILSAIITVVCCLLLIRFTDAFMAMVSYLSLYTLTFFLYLKLGNFGRATAPLMMMVVSAIVYTVAEKLYGKDKLFFYRFSLKLVTVLTLLTFYASGNYFVVKELSAQMFYVEVVPFGWLFWLFTLFIPLAYILYGIYKKDLVFFRVGLVLVAAAIFTVRYYHAVLSPEMAMLTAGAILIVVAYALIRYLKKPRFGFTFVNTRFADKELLHVEALILAQTFHKKTVVDHDVQFGGGSSGGGGATGNF